ncbi:MAG: hypothetical protein M3N08_04580, partial [Pseudomonadota bacterium]|nr:hypothetical protein [Pseudomonadota bacterium]
MNLFSIAQKSFTRRSTGGARIEAERSPIRQWNFPTIKDAAPFTIRLSATPPVVRMSGISMLRHSFGVRLSGVQHPYVTNTYGYSGDEVKNPALLRAYHYAEASIEMALDKKIKASARLSRALVDKSVKFYQLPQGTGSQLGLLFEAKESLLDWKTVRFEAVSALFEDIVAHINGLQRPISEMIKNFAWSQPPRDPGPLRLMAFEDRLTVLAGPRIP